MSNLTEIIKNLQNKILSLKIDLETEHFSKDDFLFFEKISKQLNLSIAVKIGGCEAIHDLFIAKKLNAKIITAPMIESSYALSKFINASHKVFENNLPELFINIETISAYENLESILNNENSRYLKGIVIGRNDLARSIGYSQNEVNNDKVFKITFDILENARKKKLKTIIGGNLTPKSISFLEKISLNLLDYFETRTIIFDRKKINKENRMELIKKALEFEILFLENKKNAENIVISRINDIKQRLNFKNV